MLILDLEDKQEVKRGRGIWKLNTTILKDLEFIDEVKIYIRTIEKQNITSFEKLHKIKQK